MKTRMTSYLSGALAMLLAGSAIAARLPFNQAQYEQAVAAGKPVVVYFHADWCPTCRAQQPIVDKLLGEPQFMSVTLFEADFDTETALEKSLKVTQQASFVVFKLGHEATLSTGQTQEPAIRAVLQQAL